MAPNDTCQMDIVENQQTHAGRIEAPRRRRKEANPTENRTMGKRTKTPTSTGTAEEPARAHARLEAEVVAGKRDARTLVVVPAELARAAKVTFPKDAFGKPKRW